MIYDGVQILHHVWSGIGSRGITWTRLLQHKYNTDRLHKLALPANQRNNMTFNFWSKTTSTETGDNFQKKDEKILGQDMKNLIK